MEDASLADCKDAILPFRVVSAQQAENSTLLLAGSGRAAQESRQAAEDSLQGSQAASAACRRSWARHLAQGRLALAAALAAAP